MFSHGSSNLIEFPEKTVTERYRVRAFRGKRMHFLPIIDSARIADGIANRAAWLLLDPNVERFAQCPPGCLAVCSSDP